MNTPLLDQLRDLLTLAVLALADPRPRQKFVRLALGLLCGQKPKTLSSALEWLDQSQEDWSAHYRLFSQAHWESQAPFQPLFTQALAHRACGTQRVFLGQDDTLLRKTGRKIPGVAYARDPLSPPFQVNLVLGQRFVQTSLLVQPGGSVHPWRALPVSFSPAPTPKIPKGASPEEQAAFKEVRKKHRLSLVALEQLRFCRQHLDCQPGGRQRQLIDVVDGGYSNHTFFQGLPQRTDVVGRIRKDASFRAYLPPDQRRGARKYGADLPTPWEYLQDPNLPYQDLEVFVAGKLRTLQYKVLDKSPAFVFLPAQPIEVRFPIRLAFRRWRRPRQVADGSALTVDLEALALLEGIQHAGRPPVQVAHRERFHVRHTMPDAIF